MEPLPRYRFDALVREAIDDLPNELAGVLANVVVRIADQDPDEPDLLGLYDGVPHTEQTGHEGPAVVTIYRLALCEACADGTLAGVCPNCGGELVARPRRVSAG